MASQFNNRDYPVRDRGGRSPNFDRDRNSDFNQRRDQNYSRNSNPDYGFQNRMDRNQYGDREYRYNRDYNRNRYNSYFEYSGYQDYYTASDYENQGYYGNQSGQNDWYGYDSTPVWTYTEYWIVPGPFEGVGPSNYQRSDERIKEDVNERLTQHGRIDAREIQVDVNNGEVTLTGTARSRGEKRMAEDVADSVSGVRDVHNQIKLAHKQQEKGQKMQAHEIKGGQVRGGMDVLGKDGNKIGTVKEVRQRTFLVDREVARDVYVPFDKAQESNGQVVLDIGSDQVDNQDWNKPDLIER